MGKLKVLITNFSLSARTGSELYAFDLATGLRDANHFPILYSPRAGALATQIRKETIPVIDDLGKLNITPDIIHGQHTHETVTALIRFPQTPALYVCHDWYSSLDIPPAFPRVLRYVAIDSACRDKLVFEHAVPEDRISVLLQFVDLEKFRPRAPLPAIPKRALILCNHTKENAYLASARNACARAGVSLDVYGQEVGRPSEQPELLLPQYDVVFAKGRAALEAVAVGASVVVYWWRRLGPMVTLANLEELRRQSFGVRSMSRGLTPDEFGEAIGNSLTQYNATEAAEVSAQVRAHAGRERIVSEFVSLYETVIAEHKAGTFEPEDDARAAASYLRQVSLLREVPPPARNKSTTELFAKRVRKMPLVGRLAGAAARRWADRERGE